ncbi:MAG TPA: hypothetical protein VFD32_09670 [Dehalococcoidia bacterium]|nr:hypothetical protein [Dehalococcoidia bacterium]
MALYEHGRYEIRIRGHLDPRWSTRFDGMSLTRQHDGTTLLAGPVADQAQLHGLLQKVRDLGLPLLSVTRIDSNQPDVLTCPAP